MTKFPVVLAAAALLVLGCAHSPKSTRTKPTPAPGSNGIAAMARPAGDTGKAVTPNPSAPKPYNKVITAEAKTRRGLFITHRIGDKLYFEIPARELGKDQLLVGRFARAAQGGGDTYGGDQF